MVRNHPPCPVSGGDATITYRAAFLWGDFVLVYLSSLPIPELLFWLKNDGGAVLAERLTKFAADSSTISSLMGLARKNPTQNFLLLHPSP